MNDDTEERIRAIRALHEITSSRPDLEARGEEPYRIQRYASREHAHEALDILLHCCATAVLARLVWAPHESTGLIRAAILRSIGDPAMTPHDRIAAAVVAGILHRAIAAPAPTS